MRDFMNLNDHDIIIVKLKNGQIKYAVKMGDKFFSTALYAEYKEHNTKLEQHEIDFDSIEEFSRVTQ